MEEETEEKEEEEEEEERRNRGKEERISFLSDWWGRGVLAAERKGNRVVIGASRRKVDTGIAGPLPLRVRMLLS